MSAYQLNTPAPKRSLYSRRYRLRESELLAIKGVGKRLRTEHLHAQAAPSPLPYCRVAVVVGKHGHTVVERNRLRRRLRELIRVSLIPECRSVNVVLRTLPNAYSADFRVLSVEVDEIKDQIVTSNLE